MKKSRALIFGSTGDIGKEACLALQSDFDVTEVNRSDPHSLTYEDFMLMEGTFDAVVFAFGRMTIQPLKFAKQKDWEEMFAVNFFLPVKLMTHLLKARMLNPGANVVVVSSVSGHSVWTRGHAMYSASKAALNSYIKSCAIELKRNCTINGICPGLVSGGNTDGLEAQLGADLAADEKNYPMGYIRAQSVAKTVLFLCQNASDLQVNGTLMEVDGGYNYFRQC